MAGAKQLSLKALPLLYAILLVAALVVGYHHTLHSPFVLDDAHNIVLNQYIQIKDLSLASLERLFSEFNPTRQRPVAGISFALNYLAGGYETTGYHLVNIFIHIVSALLVFRLFSWYLQKTKTLTGDAAVGLAAAAALLWAANPIQTSAVTYVVQRMTSLCSLFFLSSLLVYLSGRDLIAREGFAVRRLQKTALFLAAFLLWLLALLTKEIAAIMPAILLLHEAYFFDDLSLKRIREKKYWYLGLLLFPLILGGYYLADGLWQAIENGYAERDFTMTERLLTQTRVVLRYMSVFLYPLPSRLTLFYDFPLSRSLVDPASTLLSVLAIVALIAASCALARRYPLISFGFIWTFLCLLIESSILPLELIYEHRFYLPSVGFALAVSVALSALAARLMKWREGGQVILLGAGCILVILTFLRNQAWQSEIVLHLDGTRKAPGLARAATGLAVAYLREKRYDLAQAELERTFALEPQNVVTLANLFLVYTELGRGRLAESSLNKLKQSITDGYFHCTEALNVSLIAQFLEQEKRCDEALFFLEAMARCATVQKNSIYYASKGRCYARIGSHGKAIENFITALGLNGENPYILFSLATSYLMSGDRMKAKDILQRLMEIGVPDALRPQVEKMTGDISGHVPQNG